MVEIWTRARASRVTITLTKMGVEHLGAVIVDAFTGERKKNVFKCVYDARM